VQRLAACGLGDLLADMLEMGYNCRAVEHSPQMVAAARDTLRKRHLGQDATVMQGSAQGLPFSDATFDTVVSTFPSEYIYDPDTISEIARILRPGGRLLVIEGANLLPVSFLQTILVILQMFVYGPSAVFGPRKQRNLHEEIERGRNAKETEADISVDVLSNAWFGRNIPLEQFDLSRRSERIRSSRWEIYMIIGEKP